MYSGADRFNQEEVQSWADLYFKTKRKDIRDKILLATIRLVTKIAHELDLPKYNCALDWEDLVQEGLIFLAEALARYNPSYNTKFTTYAYLYVKGRLLAYIKENAYAVTIGRRTVEQIYSVEKARMKFIEEHGRVPTDQELAEQLNMKPEDVSRLSLFALLPLDAEVRNSRTGEEVSTLHNLVPDVANVEDEALVNVLIESVFSAFSDKQRDIINDYYAGYTMREVGSMHNCTASYVNRVVQKSKKLVRAACAEAIL